MSTTLGRLAPATAAAHPTGPADRRWRRRAVVTAIFLLAEAVMIRRTPSQLAHRITNNLGDPALIIWTLRWGGHALVHDPTGVFNGNIFWPASHTLAYADPLLSLVPVYSLLYWLSGGNFTLSLNLLDLLVILGNLAATYSLARWLTRSTEAGVLAALAFGFSAFGLAQMGHPQLELLFPLPLGFLLLFKLLERPRLWTAVGLGLLNIVILLGALYWAALYAVSVAVILAGYAIAERGGFDKARLRSLAVVVAITALSVPALIPYYQVQRDHPRRPMVEGYGLKAKDIVSPIDRSYLYRPLAKRAIAGDEHRLFPGFLTMILAVAGLAAVLRTVLGRRRGEHRRHRRASPAPGRDPTGRDRFALLLVAAGAVAVVLALGGTARGVKLPWRFFYWYVPGFGGVRVTARLAVLGLLAGAVLAGYGIRSLVERRPDPRARFALTFLAVAIILLELAAPLPWATLPQDQATLAVYHALSHRPAGAVAELPMANPDTAAFRWDLTEPVRMVWATVDYHPRLNGYSGYTPTTYAADTDVVSTFPSAGAMARLQERRVRYVILHVGVQAGAAMYSEADAQRIIAGLPPGLRADRFGNNYLIDLTSA